jgi:hypothetical protein
MPPSPRRTVVLPFAIPYKLFSLQPSPFFLTVHIDHDFNDGYQPHPYPPRASFRTFRTRGQWRHSDEELRDDLHRWTSVSRKYLTTLKTGSDCQDRFARPITTMPTSGEVICGPVTSPVRMSYGVAVTLSKPHFIPNRRRVRQLMNISQSSCRSCFSSSCRSVSSA